MLGPVGKPQWIAGTLLLIFLAQCTWLISHNLRSGDMDLREWYRLDTGLRMWHRSPPAAPADPHSALGPGPPPRIRDNDGFDPDHSALWYLISSAPLLVWPGRFQSNSLFYWGWLARVPHLAFGLLLGASLWYVARRLYGNEGGFVALTLYCFSPGMIRAASVWFAEPETGAAWGAFGTIFTAIAVAHTLYAPREVVLWNWRRTLLLGVSLALAVGSQFSLIVMAPVALLLMLYLAPTRRGAALTIWGAACAIALALLFAAYFFSPAAFLDGLRHATWLGFTPQVFSMSAAYREVFAVMGQNSPALVFALPIAAGHVHPVAARPLLRQHRPASGRDLLPHPRLRHAPLPRPGISADRHPLPVRLRRGICADLLETKQRTLVMACTFGLLLAYAFWSVVELARAGTGH